MKTSEDSIKPNPAEVDELKRIIDEELSKLPPRIQEVLVLCDLQGRSRAEAGKLLSLPAATVTTRLTRGRQLMRQRLVRRGIAFSLTAFTVAIVDSTEGASPITPSLVSLTVQNANLFLAGTESATSRLSVPIFELATKVTHAMLLRQWGVYAILILIFSTILLVGAFGSAFFVDPIIAAPVPAIFYEDFADGNARDGSPVEWAALSDWPLTRFQVAEGGLQVTASQPDHAGVVYVRSVELRDTCIRAQVRLIGRSNTGVGIFARGSGPLKSHSLEICADGGLSIGIASKFESISTRLRPTREDIMLQLDVIGDQIRGWAWRANDPMPAEPQIVRTSSELATGLIGVFFAPSTLSQGNSGTAIFRFVEVGEQPFTADR